MSALTTDSCSVGASPVMHPAPPDTRTRLSVELHRNSRVTCTIFMVNLPDPPRPSIGPQAVRLPAMYHLAMPAIHLDSILRIFHSSTRVATNVQRATTRA